MVNYLKNASSNLLKFLTGTSAICCVGVNSLLLSLSSLCSLHQMDKMALGTVWLILAHFKLLVYLGYHHTLDSVVVCRYRCAINDRNF